MRQERLFSPVTGEDLIDREEIIEKLISNFKNIDHPIAQQYALIGTRRIGKTSIIQEVYDRMKREPWEGMPIPVWLDIREIVKSSDFDKEKFALRCLAAFAEDYLRHELPDVEIPSWRNMTFEVIAYFAQQIGDRTLEKNAKFLQRDDIYAHLKSVIAMETPGEIVRNEGKWFAIIVDEIQDLFQLENGVLLVGCYRYNFESIYCLHIFTGSAVRIMSCDVFGYSSALYGRVTQEYLNPFSPIDDFKLMAKLAGEFNLTWDDDAKFFLNEVAGGYPYYTTCIVARIYENGVQHITSQAVEDAFQEELLRGRIYKEFVDRTDPQLKAMGDAQTAISILEAIVNSEENRVGVQDLRDLPDYSFDVLDSLARADVIRLNGVVAQMLDPAYKVWLRDVYLPLFWKRQPEAEAVAALSRTIRRLANDVGYLFEARVRDYMWFFKGKTAPGKFLGYPEKQVDYPCWDYITHRRLYSAAPENGLSEGFEVDVHIMFKTETRDYGYWFIECKYLDRQTTLSDLKELLCKKQIYIQAYGETEVILWFCSKHPLPARLQRFARENDIYFSSETDLDALFEMLR